MWLVWCIANIQIDSEKHLKKKLPVNSELLAPRLNWTEETHEILLKNQKLAKQYYDLKGRERAEKVVIVKRKVTLIIKKGLLVEKV